MGKGAHTSVRVKGEEGGFGLAGCLWLGRERARVGPAGSVEKERRRGVSWAGG
jgi:hypothetical protein